MNNIIESFKKIQSNIKEQSSSKPVNVIAVSKTFTLNHIQPLIDYGHIHFGENKVQEAVAKWTEVKKENQNIRLHMIGKLQSNKAKTAAQIFDYIHSLDTKKLADIFSDFEAKNGKKLKYFIQVNVGNEMQKSGVPISDVETFYDYCTKDKNLNILGLMIIPPNDANTKKYFQIIDDLNKSLSLNELSMGMSADYLDAINYNSTFVRIGSLIFGSRSK